MQKGYDVNSIRDNPKLREEVTKKLCKFLNELSLDVKNSEIEFVKSRKDLAPEQKEERIKEFEETYKTGIYSEEEINSWATNQNAIDTYDELNGNKNKLQELHDKKKEYEPNPKYGTKSSCSDRNIYLLMDTNKDVETDYYNQKLVNYTKNPETNKVISYQLIDLFEQCDQSLLFPTTELELVNMPKKGVYIQQIGFGIFDQNNSLDHDPNLQNRFKSMQSYYQGNMGKLYEEKYKNPFSLIVPPKGTTNIATVASMRSSQITRFFKDNFPNITEFKGLSDSELGTKFVDFTIGASGLQLMFEDNMKVKSMIEKGIISKNCITKSYFIDDKNQIVSFEKVLASYKDGELPTNIKKVDLNEKEIEEYETTKNGVFNNAKLIDCDIAYSELKEKKKLKDYEQKLYEKLSEFKTNYNYFLDINKDDQNKYVLASEFAYDNQKLLSEIDELNRVCVIEKYYNLDKESKFNYDQIEKAAAGLVYKVGEKDIDVIARTYPNKKEFSELTEHQFNKKKEVKDIVNTAKSFLTKNEICKSISFIREFNKKDAEYQKRWSIAKAWYKKSYTRMMNARNKLIDNLEDRGVSRDDLTKLGIDNKVSFVDIAMKASDDILNKQDDAIDKVKEAHEKYIDAPQREAAEVEKQKQKYIEETIKTRANFDKVRNETFSFFVKENNELFKNYPDMTADNLRNMEDKELRDKFRDEFRKWREKNPENENVKKYAELHSELQDLDKKVIECDDEIKERKECYKEGKFYNPVQPEEKSLIEMLKDSTEEKNIGVTQKKVSGIENPNVNKEIGKGK